MIPDVPSSFRLSSLALTALVLAGCSARAKHAAAPTEAPDYDWSGFDDGKETPAATAKAEKPEQQDRPADKPDKQHKADEQEAKVDKDAKDVAPKPAAAPDASKKISATKIAGQSVSQVTVDAVAEAMQRATRKNLVSTSVIVGAEYEQVSIVLDKLAVQIVRPASAPDRSGPKVRSPKARKSGVAQTEAAFFDPNADVLVLVQADKKATSVKALASLVSGGAGAPAKKTVRAAKPKRAS